MDGIVILVLSVALAAVAALLARSIFRMRRAMRRFEVLNRIAEVSDRGGTLRETLDSTCAIIVPELADFCMIDLVRDDRVERIAVRVGPGGGQKAVDGLAGRRPSLPEADGVGVRRRPARAALLRADDRGRPGRARPRPGGPRVPARARDQLRDHGRPEGAGQADRGADPGRRLVGAALHAASTSSSPAPSPAGWR